MTTSRLPAWSHWRGRAVLVTLALAHGVGCNKAHSAADDGADDTGPPVRGGTLRIVNASEFDHLLTISGSYILAQALQQTFARQLVKYPPAGTYEATTELVPDLARELPTRANGGISADGLVYRFHLREGVLWNSTPPRSVTAHDFVRAFKLFCNPVSPVVVPAFYTRTILGMAEQCSDFGRVRGTIDDIRTFVTSHEIAGVHAIDDRTLEFKLLGPAADFLNLLAMPCVSAVPMEYLDYLPDSPDFRQHTLSNGPYTITRYEPDRGIDFERNPVWDPRTDPHRPAWVDRISVRFGTDAELNQLQIEAGTADLTFNVIPTADLASGLAIDDPRVTLRPDRDHYADMYYLVLNLVGPNNRGALTRREVRQALAIAVDKHALVQLNGGAGVSRPLRQAVASTATGFRFGADQYVTAGDRGDPQAARRLLAEAGFGGGLGLRLAFVGSDAGKAQTVQASLSRAGVEVTLRPFSAADFLGRLLPERNNAERGEWDLALVDWIQDWYGGSNGRDTMVPLFDGRGVSGASWNFGGYNSPVVNGAIDRGLVASDVGLAEQAWAEGAAQVMRDVAIVPLLELKLAYLRSSRVRGCVWSVFGVVCDLTALWLADGAPAREAQRP